MAIVVSEWCLWRAGTTSVSVLLQYSLRAWFHKMSPFLAKDQNCWSDSGFMSREEGNSGHSVSCYTEHSPADQCFSLANLLDLYLWGPRGRFPAGAGNFSLRHSVQNGSGAHPASYPMGARALSLGVKRPGREADHSPPSSAENKDAWC